MYVYVCMMYIYIYVYIYVYIIYICIYICTHQTCDLGSMTPTLLFDPFQVVESLDPLGRWPSFLRPIFCRKLLKSYIESAGRGSAVETSRVHCGNWKRLSRMRKSCDVVKMSFFSWADLHEDSFLLHQRCNIRFIWILKTSTLLQTKRPLPTILIMIILISS